MSTAPLRELSAADSVAALERALQAARDARTVVQAAKDALRLAREKRKQAVPVVDPQRSVNGQFLGKPPARVAKYEDYQALPVTYDSEGYQVIWSGALARRTGKQLNEVIR
jgi:hypothetical protein